MFLKLQKLLKKCPFAESIFTKRPKINVSNDFFPLDSSDSDISEPDDQPLLKRPCLTAPAHAPKPRVNNPRDSINSTLHSDPRRDAFTKSLKSFRSTGGINVWTEREKDAVALFF